MFFDLTDQGLPAGTTLTSRQKNQMLCSLLGDEGYKQFASHPTAKRYATTTFDEYSAVAKSVFARATNTVRAHFDFSHRKQLPGETVQEYLLGLRTLQADCDFQDRSDFFLALQLASGCYSKDAQKLLLAEKAVNLDKFVSIMEADESSTQNATQIRGDPQVAGTSRQPPARHFDSTHSPKCNGCGKIGHIHGAKVCPALNSKCSLLDFAAFPLTFTYISIHSFVFDVLVLVDLSH